MSGIEVAGLVLGALPILLKAVEQYRGTIQVGMRFFKKRKYVERLASALLFQQGTLIEVLRNLLINSGCSDVARLDVAPFEYLGDSQIQEHLHEYLGAEIDATLTATLKQSLDTVKRIASNISGLVPTTNVSIYRLLHQCELILPRVPQTIYKRLSKPMMIQSHGSWNFFPVSS
jgi:hypothetical protein